MMSGGAGAARGGARGGLGQFFGRGGLGAQQRLPPTSDYSSEPHPHSTRGTQAMRGELWFVPAGGAAKDKKKVWCVVQDGRFTIYTSFSNQNHLVADLKFTSIHRAFHFHHTVGRERMFFFGIDVVGMKFERLVFATDAEADFNMWSHFLSQFKTLESGIQPTRSRSGSHGPERDTTVHGDDADRADADDEGEAANASERQFFRDEISRLTSTCQEWQQRANGLRCAVEDALGMARGDPDSWADTVGRLRGEIESRLASIAKAPTAATKALSAMATAFTSTLSAKADATIDATATVGANLQREMVRLRSDVAEAHAKLALSASPTRRAMTPSGAAGTDTILDAAVEGGVLDARTRELDPNGAVAAVAASLRNTGRATGGAKDTPTMAAAAAADAKRLKNENDRLREELASQRSALDAAVGGGGADGTTGGGAGQIIRGSMTLLGVRRHSNQFALGMAEDFLRTMTTARDLVVQLQRTLDTRARLGVRGREDVDRKQQSASLASREAALNDLEYVKTQRDHIRSAPQFAGLPDDLWNENWHIEVLKAVSAAEARALIAQERERDAATEAQQEANRQRSAFEQTSREQRRRLTTMIDDLTRTCQQRDEEIARMKDQFSDLKLIWAAESQILQSKLQHVRRGGAAAGGGAGATQGHDSDGHPLTPLVLPKLSAAAVVQVLSGKESLDAAAEDLNRFLLWGATHVLPLCDGPAEDRPLLAIIQSVFDAQRALSRSDAHGPLHISADEWDETAARLDHLFSLAGIPFCVSHDERLAAIEDITDRIRAADDLALPPLTRDSAAFTDDESIAVLLEKSHPTPNEIALSEMVRAKTVEAQHWFDELQRSRRDVDALISQLQRIPRRSTEDIAAERAKRTEPLRKAVRQSHATLRFSTWTRWIARIRDLRSRRRVAEAFMQATTHGRQRLAFRAWLGLVQARLAMRKRRSRSELLVTRTSEGLRRIMFRRWQLFAQDALTRRGKREAAHRAAFVFATKTSETQRRRFAWQTWARWAAQRRGHRAKLNAMSVFVSTTDRGLRHLCFSRWQRHAQTNQRRRVLDKLSALGAAQIDRVRVMAAFRKLALYAHQATGKRWARRRDDFIARTLCEAAKERFSRRYLQRWRQVVGKLRLRTHERTTRLTQLERSTTERTRRIAFSAWTRWVARIRDLRSRRRVAGAFMQATTHGRQRLAFRSWLGLVQARLAMRKRRSRSELLVSRTSEGLRRIMFRRWQLFAQDALTRRGKREAAHRAAFVFATKTSETQRRRFAWQTWARWAAQRRGHRAKLNAMSVFVSTTDRGLRHLCFSRWQRHAQTNQRRRVLDKLSALGAAQIDRVRVMAAFRKLALYAHQATGKRWARRRDDFIARALCEAAKERFSRRYLQRWRQVVGKLRLRTHERATRLTQLERSTAERTRRIAFSAWTRWVARIRDLRSRRRVAEAFMQATTHGRQRLAFRAWLGLVQARLAMRKRRSRSELLVTRTSEGLRRIMFRRWQLFAQDALTRRGKREAAHRAAFVFATKTSETQRRRFAWQTWARWAAQRRGHRAKLNAMSVFVSTTDRGLRHLCFSRWQRHAQTNQRQRLLNQANETAMSVANATNVGDRLALSLLEAGVRRTLITDTLVQRQASWLELLSPTANAALESAAVIGCSVAALPQTTSELKHDLDDLNNGVAAACHILETSSVHGGAKRSVAVLCSAVKKNVEALVKSQEVLHSATAEIAAAPPTVRRDDLASGIADLVALCKAKDAEVAATKRTSEEQQRTIEQLRSELGEGASQTDTLGQALAALQAAAQSACNTLEPTATPTRGKPVEPKQLTAAAQRAREALTSTEAQLEEARSEVEQERKRLEQLRDDIAAVEGVLHTHPRSPGARESSPSRSTVKDAEQATQRTMGAARTAVEELQKTASTLEAATAEIAAAPPTVRRDDLASGIADLVALCKAKDAEVAATKRTNEEQQRTIEQLRSELGEGASQTDTLGQALASPPGGGRRRRRAHATRWNRRPRRRAGSRSSRSS
jgi:hypothetical protein